jgi:hypothetical protein
MPRISSGRPNGVKLKKWNPAVPCLTNSALITRLRAVATRVSMPLISPAKLSGIISRLGAVPLFCDIRSTTGMKIATTAVELISASSPPTASISRTSSRVSLLPAVEFNQSPSRRATPVRTSPSPTVMTPMVT